MTEPPAKRPLITANMVTFMRLVPMPALCWLIYQGELWTAVILGTLIGCTDFIDGYLARKHGPTVLGGLMDPIADKVFIGFAYLPFADLGIVPAWAVALMFVREFLVTALRSAYEQRGLTMKTSYFGKVKTWTQMQGIGLLVFFILLVDKPDVVTGILLFCLIAPLIVLAVLWVLKRRIWTGAIINTAMTVPFLFLHIYSTLETMTAALMILIVGITWLSGIDYVSVGLRQLRGRGDFSRADAVRIIGALALPCLIFAVLVETSMPAWPLAAILAVELAVGGLDNLLSHHKAGAGALTWSARVLGTSLLLVVALFLADSSHEDFLTWLGGAAAALCVVGVANEFWRGRDYYLDQRLRDKALAAAKKPNSTSQAT